MSKPLYLGEMLLHWCRNCNVPVLGKECACGSSAESVTVTPPGDIRPAFEYDIELINSVSMLQFNAPLIADERVVVLNKAPYDDRMDEIIVDGEVLGSIRFELDTLKWVLLLRVEGARRLFQTNTLSALKGWVVLEQGAVTFILGGANLLAPGVLDADPGIQEKDEVVILDPNGQVVATGRARMSGERMRERPKGVAVKVRDKEEPCKVVVPQGGQTWKEVLDANKHFMDEFIGRSHKFINNVASSMTKQVTVSYSGGKDSLVVLQLVSECLEDFDILFADTGIEFPETVSNTQEVSQLYGKPLRSISSGNAFWESVDSFGPPSVEMRWCCKVCKLGPITQLIEGNYEEGCLTFIGQRKYESDTRAKSERVWKNPWVGNQIGAAPIQDWTAMHVWLYIFMHGLPYNPLYKKGFDRIGCWLCPSCSVADLHRLRATHPEFASKLENYLLGYAQRSGLSPEWVEHGMWRWKKLPPRLQEIAKAKGILTTPKVEINGKFEFTVTSGYRPCKQGGVSAEGSFATPLDMETIESSGMLEAVGKVAFMEGVASIFQGEDSAQIFAAGTVTARSDNEKHVLQLVRSVELSIKRALRCSGCGVCVGKCPHDVIKMKKNIAVIGEGCIHCGKCIEVCPVVKFG